MSEFTQSLSQTMSELGSAFGSWRGQVFGLAKNDLSKKTKKSALGWFWLFFQPMVYIVCFWFAIYIGIKSAKNGLDASHFMLWLAAGVIPWWFMRGSLNSAPNALNAYSYLITKLKFPVALIPVFTELSQFLLQIALTALLFIGYLAMGGQINIYLLQLPLIMLLMFVFFTGYSMLVSPICAMSEDMAQFLKALVTPIFWLSGILFDTTTIENPAVQFALKLDPVSFFATSYRKVLGGVDQGWFWDDPEFLAFGLVIIVVTCVLGVLVFSRLRKEVADVL